MAGCTEHKTRTPENLRSSPRSAFSNFDFLIIMKTYSKRAGLVKEKKRPSTVVLYYKKIIFPINFPISKKMTGTMHFFF